VIALPKDILERVERVLDYHRVSKHSFQSVAALKPQTDPSQQPASVLTFADLPKISLPTGLLDLTVPAMWLMREGLGALPESHVRPPQDLKTIASWMHMAYGVTSKRSWQGHPYRLRACPSGSALFPCEIYLAAFAIEGLEPGLYSFNPHEFSLTKLREGIETLSHIKRGRPDLAFLRSVPAALLVSTNYWRSAWKYRVRGMRVALEDAGHLIANLVGVANGLGIQTMTRLKMNDNTMRELIGIPHECEFGEFEAVQAMIVWADGALRPLESPPGAPSLASLPPIHRPPISPKSVPYGSIIAAHYDCVSPGIPLRDIKPPYTELSPMPLVHHSQQFNFELDYLASPSLRHVLLERRSSRDFDHLTMERDRFLAINQCAFRTGTFLPLHPDGPHVGLIRPYWVVHAIPGMTPGIWYYHPHTNRWVMVKAGMFRSQSQMMCIGQARCGNAAALCVMVSNLPVAMHGCGPDVYRMAHLEAGIAGQRLALAAAASGVGSCGICSFYDDEVSSFLGLQNSGWEVLYATALGMTAKETAPAGYPGLGIG
jgi:SagB-type dehydrogenase family enzyme